MGEDFFLKGTAIGLAVAAPVGPIGVLCIRRSLAHGFHFGLAKGLGAATADAAYGCVAGFGLTAISRFLMNQQFWLALLGGAFLCYLGVWTFANKPPDQPLNAQASRLPAAYFSTLFLTLTNPLTILSFAAVFASFGLGATGKLNNASVLVAGVFVGSALWWLVLSGAVSLCRSRVGPGLMTMVNRISGIVIGGFGIYAVAKLFLK